MHLSQICFLPQAARSAPRDSLLCRSLFPPWLNELDHPSVVHKGHLDRQRIAYFDEFVNVSIPFLSSFPPSPPFPLIPTPCNFFLDFALNYVTVLLQFLCANKGKLNNNSVHLRTKLIRLNTHFMAQVKPDIETFAKIKVVGIGGGGSAAINRMISDNIKGVEFIVINTDVQALNQNLAATKIAIGKTITRGLGAGMNPEVGARAAEETQNEIREALMGSDMVFLTCGLGGGTGTGAIPEVAKLAKDIGALTVAVVTKPFTFEGAQRRRIAEEGYERLLKHVDAIITIPNDRVLQIIDKKTSLMDAFSVVDDVLRQGVQGIAELITVPGLINVDFADVKAIMENSGSALMGIGRASGENRAVEAAKQAIASPLLELSVDGARGILFTITGGSDLGMHEVAEAAKIITSSADEDAKVIFGANIDDSLGDEIRIAVVDTGFDSRERRTTSPGVVEVQAQGTWAPNTFLRVREEESLQRPAPRPKVNFQSSKPLMEVRSPQMEIRRETYNPPTPIMAPQPVQAPAPMPVMQQQEPMRVAPRPAPVMPTPQQSQEDEIEIPAFIRKKMI